VKSVPYISVALLLYTTTVWSQPSTCLDDTLKIKEVLVTGKPVLRASGFTKIIIDTSLIRENVNNSVANILRSGSPLFVKTYGPGGIATVSLRGAGASHTVVTWNGISLNSIMAGQTDFTLLPALLADEITVYNGGSSVAMAQGGLGGVVDVTTVPEWNMEGRHQVFLSAGSYGRFSSSYIGRYGSGNWKFASRVGISRASNDFRYVNNYLADEAVREKRENAFFQQKVALQEAWHKSNRSVTGIKIWIQESRRDIPVPVNISPSSHDEHLGNFSILGNLNHTFFFAKKIIWSTSASVHSDEMHYQDLVTGTDSPASFNRITFSSALFLNKGERTSIKATLSGEAAKARSANYAAGISRYISSLSLSADYRLGNLSDINVTSVVSIADGNILPPDLSAGIELKPVEGKELTLKTNIASKTRVPTMNDLYWIPGGNSLLKPERGYSGEISAEYEDYLFRNLKINLRTTAYINSVNDMIVWQPGAGGIWSPENTGRISSRGVESGGSLSVESGINYIRMLMTYTNTVSGEEGDNYQLIYVPRHMSYIELRGAAGRFVAGTSWQYTGKRFITTDNTQYLPPYTHTDVWAGIRSISRGMPVDVTVRIENLFNVNYQVVAYHPMPPASVLLNISLKMNNSRRK